MSRRSRSSVGRMGAALAVLGFGARNALAQCALCRDAVAASSAETREAMNYAIVGLAFAPYAVGALAVWLLSPNLRGHVRARLKRPTKGKAEVRLL
jgi:hypothetical protein